MGGPCVPKLDLASIPQVPAQHWRPVLHPPNVEKVLKSLKPSDLVLDVGGWACPFNRAQWVLDAEPYETRGFYRTFGGASSQGGDREWFTEDTWVRHDICARQPWPFADK